MGGIFPRVFEPGYSVTIKIRYDDYNIFKILRNDTVKVISHYKIDEADNGMDKISYSDIINYDYSFDVDTGFANIRSDTLEIWDGMIDGYTSFYKKIR